MKSSSPQKKIFISYRVQDSAGETGRLVDALRGRFSNDQLFLDIDNLEPGADFSEVIEKYLDICDVFLAVIGPHWTAEREGGGSRIMEAADWVRMEASTALQRGIRVVPVLVGGAALPKPEQLPDDLQPLLRKQAIEISNKRWKYDTDQLIDFLITKVGIQPRRPMAQAALQAAPTKRPVWPFVVGGFVLCFVIIMIIGSLMNGEEKTGNPPVQNSTDNTTRPEETTAQNASNADNSGNAGNSVNININGSWVEDDAGEKSTFVFTQHGQTVDVAVQAMGQNMASGSGEINGGNVVLNLPLFGIATVLRLTLSANGRELNGTYTMQNTGVPQSIKLVRMQD